MDNFVPTEGCQRDIERVLQMMEKVMALPRFSGQSEATFCQKILAERNFRAKLQQGRMTIRKIRSSYDHLNRLLLDAEKGTAA